MGEDEGRSDNGSDRAGDGEARPLDPAVQAKLRETTARVLVSLTRREREVLRARFGIGINTERTLVKVGQQFSVTRERIREIEAKARWKRRPRGAPTRYCYVFRPFTADDIPEIARWWSDPVWQIEVLRRDLAKPDFEMLVIVFDGCRVGYFQIYDASPGTADAIADQPPGTRGLDLFFCNSSMFGCCDGPAILRRIADRTLIEPEAVRVIADLDPDNDHALRCFEQAGFRRDRVIQQPWGPAVLMVFTKGDLG